MSAVKPEFRAEAREPARDPASLAFAKAPPATAGSTT